MHGLQSALFQQRKARPSFLKLSAQEWRVYFGLNCVSWGLFVFVALCVLATLFTTRLHASGSLIPINALAPVLFGSVFLFYALVRKDPLIIILFGALTLVTAFAYADAMFSYVGVFWGARFPFVDAQLAAADQFLGLDWVGYLHWMNIHPELGKILNSAYCSIYPQSVFLILLLTISGRHRRLQVFILASQITAFVTCLIAALYPTLGPYFVHHVDALRDHPNIPLITTTGSATAVLNLRGLNPILPFESFDGIISFPSFHTVIAILFMWAAWPYRILRWIFCVLNLALIIETPISGSHYFMDVLAGFFVAIAGLFVALSIAARIERARRTDSRSLTAVARPVRGQASTNPG